MPSLNELLAAKKAAEGKRQPAPEEVPARAGGGLKISASDPPPSSASEGSPFEMKEMIGLVPGGMGSGVSRCLGRTEGEAVGVGDRAESADPTWDAALAGLATDLRIWVEEEGSHGWLAVERQDSGQPLVLLCRLPVSQRVRHQDPF